MQEINMKIILIVEDSSMYQDFYKESLPEFTLIQAYTLSEGRLLFESTEDIAAVVLDGQLGNGEYGQTLAGEIRAAGYSGPMIATSSLSTFNENLRREGCNHQANKKDIPDFLRRLLIF